MLHIYTQLNNQYFLSVYCRKFFNVNHCNIKFKKIRHLLFHTIKANLSTKFTRNLLALKEARFI